MKSLTFSESSLSSSPLTYGEPAVIKRLKSLATLKVSRARIRIFSWTFMPFFSSIVIWYSSSFSSDRACISSVLLCSVSRWFDMYRNPPTSLIIPY